MAADYYEVLGVAPDASPDDVKRAFRRLAREHHPDATGGEDERYKEISEAYAVLSDPARRREYDMQRSGIGIGGFGASIVEDLFESFFGGGTRARSATRTRARRGESIEVPMELTFRDAVFGAHRTVRMQRYDPCSRCSGSGCEPGTYPVRCDTCGGTGQVQQVRRTVLGQMVTAYPCARCEGAGQTVASPCRSCRSTGRLPEEAEIEIDVPPGIDDGDRLKVPGQGEAGYAGGGRGDLYVRFFVQPDDRFQRAGDDLVTWAEVPMTTAALGGRVRFESLDGDEELQVPRGTQSGALFRIRGRGQPRRGGRARGDLIVRAHVVTPSDLDAEQEKLLRNLADLRGEHGEAGGGFMSRLRRALGMEE